MPVESPLRFLRQIRQDRFQPDVDRLAASIEIAPAMEIVLVHHRTPVLALRPQNEIQRLADGGLSDVVAAHKQRVTREVHNAFGHTPEVSNFQTPDLHEFRWLPVPPLLSSWRSIIVLKLSVSSALNRPRP